jgi:hypothetical protein
MLVSLCAFVLLHNFEALQEPRTLFRWLQRGIVELASSSSIQRPGKLDGQYVSRRSRG